MNQYIDCELKEIAEDGTFRGIASVYGAEDLGGDVINKGAFTKTIQENPNIVILWQHDAREVIGTGTVKEWQGKIMLDGKLDLEDPMGQKAYKKLKNRMIKGLSIGFQAIKTSWKDIEGRAVRHIEELKLWEVSVVTFPMLPSAQVTSVKNADELQQRIDALETKLKALEEAKPATPAAEPPIEPVVDHSRVSQKLTELRELFNR
jgi:hypothetical protein